MVGPDTDAAVLHTKTNAILYLGQIDLYPASGRRIPKGIGQEVGQRLDGTIGVSLDERQSGRQLDAEFDSFGHKVCAQTLDCACTMVEGGIGRSMNANWRASARESRCRSSARRRSRPA